MLLSDNLVFATNNAHKLDEVRSILGSRFTVKSLKEIGCEADIPETADTLEGNALMKARFLYEKYGVDCFADDTGLEVTALGGAPGVHTARYAGNHDSEANMKKLLNELEKKSDRSAQFRTVIALIIEGKEFLFEGIVKGTIAKEKAGDGGFGYDPIFIPDGFTQTFSQMGNDSKNHISHRALAVEKLFNYLNSI
ncbi:MAG: non-canonical purine NTP diphosphatase [Bacteroidaceae bacterium]|jgi:XTP/dITP diphosphohydrolase|nr:non-canonical purine NTP diphosphatase [Bacteroidaceae bacterium]